MSAGEFQPGGPVPPPAQLSLFDLPPDPDVIVAGPPLESASGPTETTYIEVPEPALRALLDLAIGSLDFGSGFWEQEDCDVARFVAELLDVCPNAATPTDMLSKYPECEGTEERPYFGGTSTYWKHNEHAPNGQPA